MKTIYNDRYAAKVWLPGLLGIAALGFGVTAQPLNWRDLFVGAVFLSLAIYQLYLRRSRERQAD